MKDHCHNSAQADRHAQKVGEEERRDKAWKSHREELALTLMAGGTIYLDRSPLLDIDNVESEMAEDENMRDAIICCHRDETGAGALLAQAKREAVKRLLEHFGDVLREQFEKHNDNDFFEYREAV